MGNTSQTIDYKTVTVTVIVTAITTETETATVALSWLSQPCKCGSGWWNAEVAHLKDTLKVHCTFILLVSTHKCLPLAAAQPLPLPLPLMLLVRISNSRFEYKLTLSRCSNFQSGFCCLCHQFECCSNSSNCIRQIQAMYVDGLCIFARCA